MKGKQDMSSMDKMILFDDNFCLGEMAWIAAYVIIISSLDRIIEKTYSELLSFVKKIGFENLLSEENKLEKGQREKRRKEIEDFTFWRNKVFAHTVYASADKYVPYNFLCSNCKEKIKNRNKKEKVNSFTEQSSLAFFSGVTVGIGSRDDFFEIGGGGMSYHRERISTGTKLSYSFPIMSIVRDHNKIKKHFEEWEKMLFDVLEKIKAVDNNEIMKKNKHIKKIIYS